MGDEFLQNATATRTDNYPAARYQQPADTATRFTASGQICRRYGITG